MKVVVMGRDGVINAPADGGIRTPGQWQALPGALEAIARLNHAGVRVYVVTDQPALATGDLSHDDLFAIHQRMQQSLAQYGGRLDAIAFNPHGEATGRETDRSKPALIRDIARRLQIDTRTIPVIGDEWGDVETARQIGGRPVLVRTGNGADTEREHADTLDDTLIADDLTAAVAELLAGNQATGSR